MVLRKAALAIGAACCVVCTAAAQEPSAQRVDLSASPFGPVQVSNEEAGKLEMPKLAFEPTPEDLTNYDKYYYFRRSNTDFATAYADLSECDGYARGLTSAFKGADVPYYYQGTVAGAVGGAIGNAMVAAIFIPGEKRRMRRVNMRQCMSFKGYDRYGLSKPLWELFNFEEGTGAEKEESRVKALKLQALVAAQGAPQGEVLGR